VDTVDWALSAEKYREVWGGVWENAGVVAGRLFNWYIGSDPRLT
jgi:hypothetical protein